MISYDIDQLLPIDTNQRVPRGICFVRGRLINSSIVTRAHNRRRRRRAAGDLAIRKELH